MHELARSSYTKVLHVNFIEYMSIQNLRRSVGEKKGKGISAFSSTKNTRTLVLSDGKERITFIIYFGGSDHNGCIPGVAIFFEILSGKYVTLPLSHAGKSESTTEGHVFTVRGPPRKAHKSVIPSFFLDHYYLFVNSGIR